ncbi:hypothetical protein PHMEG_00017919, partial [Phytophthora megakarya]
MAAETLVEATTPTVGRVTNVSGAKRSRAAIASTNHGNNHHEVLLEGRRDGSGTAPASDVNLWETTDAPQFAGYQSTSMNGFLKSKGSWNILQVGRSCYELGLTVTMNGPCPRLMKTDRTDERSSRGEWDVAASRTSET